jgi:hypothetical protein
MRPASIESTAWVVGFVGLAVLAVGGYSSPQSLAHAWLSSMTLWMSWPLGCMAVLLVHALTGGRWGLILRGPLTAGLSTLPLLLLALLPWLWGLSRLYPWLGPDADRLPNHFYLNAPFLAVRGTIYLLVWFGLGLKVWRAVRAADSLAALRSVAPLGLILLALTITFASIDLTMSLDPHFTSSVYGLIALVSTGLTALSSSILVLALGGHRPSPEAVATVGKLLQGLVLFWGYLDFMQLLILWQSNLPTDSAWYVARMRDGWQYYALAITCCHFLLPAACLVFSPARRSRRTLCIVAGLVLLGEMLRAWWLVLPAAGLRLDFTDLGAMLCLAGLGSALVIRRGPACE